MEGLKECVGVHGDERNDGTITYDDRQGRSDRHREVERRLCGSRVSVRLVEREPDEEWPHSTFGVRLVSSRFRSASLLFLVGLLALLPLLREVDRDADCERECDDVRGSGTTSTRPPFGGMITYVSPGRGGGSTTGCPGTYLYSTWRVR